MSVESDFVYIGEKNSKEAQDYDINLLSPEDFEIIRPRCDIPSPLQYSLEEGVTRPISTPMTDANQNKDPCASGNPSPSSHPAGDKETVVDNLTAKFYGRESEGGEKDKVVRPVTSYCFSLRRKDSDFASSANSDETLDLPFVDSPLTSNAPSDSNARTMSFANALESNKSVESSSSSKTTKGAFQKSSRGSGHYQSTLVIVTPPGFKVGADSLPTGKPTSGRTNILPSGKTVKESSNKLRPPTTMSSVALKTLPVVRNKKADPLYAKGGLVGGSSVLVHPKYTPVATSDLSGENRHAQSPRDNSNDNEKLEDSSESQQSALLWKSGVLLSQSSADTSNGETDEKASQSSESGYEGQELSCLSPDSCYGVNVVIDDTSRNIPQFQTNEASQQNVAILEGYDQPLTVSSGLLNNSTVSEQAFLHITSMNSETDSVPSDRLSGEVVITQHVLSFPQLYSCHWEGCNTHLLSVDDLISHAVSAHVKPGKDQQYCCHWQGCQRDGRTFNARYKMLIHLRTHTGEKPHVCQVEGCGKSFSRMENLKIHMRCHTGEKPYKCPYEGCGKRYSNSSDRFKHTKTHYEKKPYRCKFEGCQKSYTDPSSLRKHHKGHRTKVALSLFVQSESESL